MLHKNKDDFIKILNQVAMQTRFLLPLVEKDYYLTLILSRVPELSEDLIFKGGTCLNKIYYAYYRLSEDLDFSLRLPRYEATRGERRQCIQPVKDKIKKYVEQFDLKLDDSLNPGRNESKQYVYYFIYQSVVLPVEAKIKFEIGLRYNPIGEIKKYQVQHQFLHQFTREPLFDGGAVNCLELNELIAEKLRAAATRPVIAPRDFYDIDFILRHGFDLADKKVRALFQKKLKEDSADPDLLKYRVNLGRTETEIKDMRGRIENELLDILTPDERKNFNLDAALNRINQAMKSIKQ